MKFWKTISLAALAMIMAAGCARPILKGHVQPSKTKDQSTRVKRVVIFPFENYSESKDVDKTVDALLPAAILDEDVFVEVEDTRFVRDVMVGRPAFAVPQATLAAVGSQAHSFKPFRDGSRVVVHVINSGRTQQPDEVVLCELLVMDLAVIGDVPDIAMLAVTVTIRVDCKRNPFSLHPDQPRGSQQHQDDCGPSPAQEARMLLRRCHRSARTSPFLLLPLLHPSPSGRG